MKTLLLHAATFDTFWAHYNAHTDPDFIARLQSLGYNLALSTQAPLEGSEWILFCEATSVGLGNIGQMGKIKKLLKQIIQPSKVPTRDVYKETQLVGLKDRVALVVFEGVLYMPENYYPELHSMFPIVFTWNDNLVDGKHIFKFRWPQPLHWPEVEKISFANRKLLVTISANKYFYHPLELFSVRRAAIKYFERAWPKDFDLYGIGWNAPVTWSQRVGKSKTPHYPSYRGIIQDKATLFPRYRFALCYENASTTGFITEKIFDCMRSGCVPVYLGAPNITDFVNADAFIDRRRFESDEELGHYLADMSEQEYQHFQNAIQEYLASKLFASFLSPAFAETIVSVLSYRENE